MPLPDLTRRRDLDRPLNADEFDADIDNLDQRVTAIEDNPPTAVRSPASHPSAIR
jgi:hypothetical protein